MGQLFDRFPIFEANQVLTSGHLNDVFDYLDQQTRQTRSYLIGIGIVCGLEIKLDTSAGTAIHLSKGCGVTSEGYLIVEPEDVSLVSYRKYTMPADLDYPPFANTDLWELFAKGEPNTTVLNSPATFLADKAVLLFFELKKQGLRNCSPNNCDDKGSEVTATVRRLLIRSKDLDKIIAAALKLGGGLTTSDIDATLSARLNLPDLRLRRFDVLNSHPTTSNDVYAAFLNIFHASGLAQGTGNALSAAYTAFQPLLQAAYPANPFANFNAVYGFLDGTPVNTVQVKFLQYYVDLFDDLLHAYDEFRWKGLELICACCPPDGIFPRHLMLGLVHPESVSQPGHYRQSFLASPAVGDCANETKALAQLFARLVEITARFTNAPSLPKADPKAPIDPQIRATPSTLGERPLATKAIPYYYTQNGTTPLYKLWSVEKTRRNRAAQNLSYRSDEYTPPAPAFVTDPLRYDLEPYNFLRVEGHLGKDYQHVLGSLLSMRSEYRLPIDVIALRTGVYDDTQTVDLSKETARFQDLEALYESLRLELLSSLAEGCMELYDVVVTGLQPPLAAGTPQLPLLKTYAPHYSYPANSVGAWYEKYLTAFQTRPYIDVDQNKVDSNAVLMVYCVLFNGTAGLPNENYAHAVSIYYSMKLSEILPATLDALAYADFENKYQDLLELIRFFRSEAIGKVTADLKTFLPEEELINICEETLFNCKLGAVKAVHDEYVRRIGDLKKRQFLSYFLSLHPGIQHKAGVPTGGTFILVYHDDPTPPGVGHIAVNAGVISQAMAAENARVLAEAPAAERVTMSASGPARSGMVGNAALINAVTRISSNRALAENSDISLVINSLTGKIPIFDGNLVLPGLDEASTKIISTAVNELVDGTVIADFYLPYRVSCDCPGTQYVLPKHVPTFTTRVGCADPNGMASVTVEVKGGVAPYDISVDQGAYQALTGPLQLNGGTHSLVVRDADGTETSAKPVTVAAPLVIGAPTYTCADGKFTATATITGGTPPYTVNGKVIAKDTFTTDPAASGTQVSVDVLDSNSCPAKASFTHVCPPPCTLPCAGIALRRGYRFWIPDADPNNAYKSFKLADCTFKVESSTGNLVDLSTKIAPILVATASQLTPAGFPKLVTSWVDQINKIIASEPLLNQAGKAQWLTLAYEAAGPGRLGVLWIDHFECLKFDIRIRSSISRTADGIVSASYTPDGTAIAVNEAATSVPAFEGTKTDKCSQNPTPEKLCPTPPNFTLKVTPTVTGTSLSLTVAVTPATPDLTFVWEVQDGTPAMGNGTTFKTQFTPGGATKLVTVTAFTKAGCTVVQSTQVPVG
jgi:hypothetical protein